MSAQSQTLDGTRFLVIAAAIVIILYGVNQAQAVVVLFLVSAFIALIGTRPVRWLEQKRFPPLVAVLMVMVGMVTLFLFIGGIVITSLNNFAETLPFYQARFHEQVLALNALLASKNIIITDKVLLEYFNPGSVLGLTAGLFAGMGQALSGLALILLTVAFTLLEGSSFPIKLRAAIGDPHQAFPQITKFVSGIERYMVIKTLVSLATGILIAVWLAILGVDFPILWGFLAFLLNYVPNVGSAIAAIPAILVALVQLGPGSAVMAAAGYIVVNTLLGNIIETRIMGQRLGLSTLVVFVSLIFWGGLLGPVGMILCVPLTMAVKFAFETNASTRWIAALLGPEKATQIVTPASHKRSHPPA
jgi:AI-2 transport protein TqsA